MHKTKDNLLITLCVIITFSCLVVCALFIFEYKQIKDEYSVLKKQLSELQVKGIQDTANPQTELRWKSFEESYYVGQLNRNIKFFFTMITIFFSVVLFFAGFVGKDWVNKMIISKTTPLEENLSAINGKIRNKIKYINDIFNEKLENIYNGQTSISKIQAESFFKAGKYDSAITVYMIASTIEVMKQNPNIEEVAKMLVMIDKLVKTQPQNIGNKEWVRDSVLTFMSLRLPFSKQAQILMSSIVSELNKEIKNT